MNFTTEETNLMCLYGTETRKSLIDELKKMKCYIQDDEIELMLLTVSVLGKLNIMTDNEFENIKDSLTVSF